MAIEIFNRFEHKYKVDDATLEKVLLTLDRHMTPDKHCGTNHGLYTIANIYYDTADNSLIRESLSKPAYKEKLRLRSYGVPNQNDTVYLEIKKKFCGLVNKRRTALRLGEAYEFLDTGKMPEMHRYMNKQVVHELEYFLKIHDLMPKVYIAYDRLAYFEKGNDDLRISFDTNIRTRRDNVALEAGDYGERLLEEGMWIMEIKTSFAKPVWLCDMLAELDLKDSSFSKYGTEYKHMLAQSREKKIYIPAVRTGMVHAV